VVERFSARYVRAGRLTIDGHPSLSALKQRKGATPSTVEIMRIRTLVGRLDDEVVVDLRDGFGTHRYHRIVEFE
jgi:hypothetical protein